MKTLPYDVSRCSGTIRFSVSHDDDGWPVRDTCPERNTCQRYQAFRLWDKKAGIDNYNRIAVSMAVIYCDHKIEVHQE